MQVTEVGNDLGGGVAGRMRFSLKALDAVGLSWLTRLSKPGQRSGAVPLDRQTGVVVLILGGSVGTMQEHWSSSLSSRGGSGIHGRADQDPLKPLRLSAGLGSPGAAGGW